MVVKTEKGFNGNYIHFDENDNVAGTSVANPFMSNQLIHYNINRHICGKSNPDFSGGYIHYDAQGNIVGKSIKSSSYGFVSYDTNGNVVGRTEEGFGIFVHKNTLSIIFGG